MPKDKPEPAPDDAPTGNPTPIPSMEDLLVGMSKDAFPEGAMCTGWVIVSEWMDADGQFWTFTGADDRNPPWRHLGLIYHVLESGSYENTRDRDDDE